MMIKGDWGLGIEMRGNEKREKRRGWVWDWGLGLGLVGG